MWTWCHTDNPLNCKLATNLQKKSLRLKVLRQNWKATLSFSCKKLSFYSMILKYTKHWHLPIQRQQRTERGQWETGRYSQSTATAQLHKCSPKTSRVNHSAFSWFLLCLLPWNCCLNGPHNTRDTETDVNSLFCVKPKLMLHIKNKYSRMQVFKMSHSRTLQK